jgi:hypothetical protein
MPQLLIVLGGVLVLAGLGGIAAGAPSWALGMGLGSTLIQSGTISFVGGLILVGMSLLLKSIQELSQRIDMMPRTHGAGRQLPAPAHAEQPLPPPAPQAREFGREPRSEMRDPRDPREARDPREQPPMRSRREPPPLPAQQDDRYPPHDDRSMPPPPERRAPDPRRMPPMQQEEWGARAGDPYAQQQMAPPPSQRGRQPEQPMLDPRGAPAVPTVVRSGIIGGMAYTLYSDGSIEAELPIGTVRFDSIQELQEHVSNTGMDADMQFNEPVR